MVRFERRIGIRPGKEREARDWVVELAHYTNRTLAPPTWHVLQPQFGEEDMFTIVLVADFPSLAEMEQHLERIFADPGFQQINTRGYEVTQRPVVARTYNSLT